MLICRDIGVFPPLLSRLSFLGLGVQAHDGVSNHFAAAARTNCAISLYPISPWLRTISLVPSKPFSLCIEKSVHAATDNAKQLCTLIDLLDTCNGKSVIGKCMHKWINFWKLHDLQLVSPGRYPTIILRQLGLAATLSGGAVVTELNHLCSD